MLSIVSQLYFGLTVRWAIDLIYVLIVTICMGSLRVRDLGWLCSKCWLSMTYRKQSNLSVITGAYERLSFVHAVKHAASHIPHVQSVQQKSSNILLHLQLPAGKYRWISYRKNQNVGSNLYDYCIAKLRHQRCRIDSGERQILKGCLGYSQSQQGAYLGDILSWWVDKDCPDVTNVSVELSKSKHSTSAEWKSSLSIPDVLYSSMQVSVLCNRWLVTSSHAERSLRGNATDDLVDLRIIQG